MVNLITAIFLQRRDATKPNLTQMEIEDSPKSNSLFALSFKSDDGKRYYVNASVTGQPLVIDSTTGPQYIFNHVIPTIEIE